MKKNILLMGVAVLMIAGMSDLYAPQAKEREMTAEDWGKEYAEKDADIYAKAFIAAVNQGHFDVMEVLLKHGVTVESTNEFGQTALIKASMSGQTDVVQWLLEHKADVVAFGDEGETAFTHVHDAAIVPLLANAGADINAQDNRGYTGLMSAVMCGCDQSLQITREFLQHKADLDLKNNEGKTALILAVESNKPETVKLLLDAGADAWVVDNAGNNALFYAAENKFDDIAKIILEHGEATQKDGEQTEHAEKEQKQKSYEEEAE